MFGARDTIRPGAFSVPGCSLPFRVASLSHAGMARIGMAERNRNPKMHTFRANGTWLSSEKAVGLGRQAAAKKNPRLRRKRRGLYGTPSLHDLRSRRRCEERGTGRSSGFRISLPAAPSQGRTGNGSARSCPQWPYAAFVPGYSGESAMAFHHFPYFSCPHYRNRILSQVDLILLLILYRG